MSFPRWPVRKHGIYRRRLVVLYPNMTVLKAIDSSPLQFYARNDMSLRTCENRKKANTRYPKTSSSKATNF